MGFGLGMVAGYAIIYKLNSLNLIGWGLTLQPIDHGFDV